MKPLLLELDAAPGLGAGLAGRLCADVGGLDLRQFPDGESYVRFDTPVAGRDLILLCTLDRPDPKLAPLLFAAAAARRQGAASVGLAAPYLAYMRQDKVFRPGEAVTSEIFARLLSDKVDWLVTVDPHLHRYPALDSIYSAPALAATAADAVGRWIATNVERPLIIGPDQESRPLVERIAKHTGGRATILEKRRSGDYSVRIDDDGLELVEGATPRARRRHRIDRTHSHRGDRRHRPPWRNGAALRGRPRGLRGGLLPAPSRFRGGTGRQHQHGRSREQYDRY